jgi:hypothetical protein
MQNIKPSPTFDRLELARWLISRVDVLRMSLSSRAAVILSADAIIAAGATILSGRLTRDALWGGRGALGALVLLSVGSLILAALSISHAIRGIINVTPSRSFFDRDEDFGLFFDPSNTAQTIKSTEEFRREFVDLDDRAALDSALADLWKITYFHYSRYQSVRRAAKLLLAALAAFIVALVASLILSFIDIL